ncbi:hypothetical protein OROHE_000498 [Orobanche hederae]
MKNNGKFRLALRFQHYHSKTAKSLLSLITSSFIFSQNRACSSIPVPNAKNSVLVDYLTGSLQFSQARALAISTRFIRTKSLERPEKVVIFFKALGLSDTQIQSVAHTVPNILFANAERTLKPKVGFLQELGLSGPCLVSFISRNPHALNFSLDRSLRPSILLIKKVLENDGRNKSDEKIASDLFRVLMRGSWIIGIHMKSRVEANIRFLESCGIVGSQLSALLLRRTGIFSMSEEKVEQVVSRALDMGFTLGSKMLVHAVCSLSSLNIKTLNGKFEAVRVFGFSDDELLSMFRQSPCAFNPSEAKLRWKYEFFLNNLKIDKLVLVKYPVLMTFSVEKRVIPRFKVLAILKSRKLCRKDLSFYYVMCMSNSRFLQDCILRFKDDAGELLSAYNDHQPPGNPES